jgi:hypothetical protein
LVMSVFLTNTCGVFPPNRADMAWHMAK